VECVFRCSVDGNMVLMFAQCIKFLLKILVSGVHRNVKLSIYIILNTIFTSLPDTTTDFMSYAFVLFTALAF
jgi:hypothetical protein